MGKFCSNCGSELNDVQVVCLKCGMAVNNNNLQNNIPTIKKENKKGKGIASMVLGILAVIYAISAFMAIFEFDTTLSYYTGVSRIGFAFGFVLIQSIFAIIAISLSLAERSQNKNGFNTSGLWLSIATFICVAIQIVIVLIY